MCNILQYEDYKYPIMQNINYHICEEFSSENTRSHIWTKVS